MSLRLVSDSLSLLRSVQQLHSPPPRLARFPDSRLNARKLMDMSLLGAGFQHTNFRYLPVPFPIIPSVSLSTTSPTTAISAKRNSQPKTAAATTTTTITLREEPPNSVKRKNGNGSVTGVHKRRHSKSYLERQSAILEVQQASDLGHAIAR